MPGIIMWIIVALGSLGIILVSDAIPRMLEAAKSLKSLYDNKRYTVHSYITNSHGMVTFVARHLFTTDCSKYKLFMFKEGDLLFLHSSYNSYRWLGYEISIFDNAADLAKTLPQLLASDPSASSKTTEIQKGLHAACQEMPNDRFSRISSPRSTYYEDMLDKELARLAAQRKEIT